MIQTGGTAPAPKKAIFAKDFYRKIKNMEHGISSTGQISGARVFPTPKKSP
jgi:hypothetical protein